MKNFYRLGVCLGMVALACMCIACSNKSGSSISESSVTNKVTITQITDSTKLPSSKESTLTDTSISSETNEILTITPPAKRVYPIKKQDEIDLFNAMELDIKDFPADGVIETSAAACDPDYIYYYRYESYFLEEEAVKYFEAIHDAILVDEAGRTLEGTCDITEKDGYTLLVGCGTYDGIAPLYYVVVLVDETVVSGFTYSTEESDKQMINNYFIGLGYM